MNKKGLIALVSVALLFGAAKVQANGTTYVPPPKAEKAPAGGLELSGNVTVVTGWQHDSKNAGTNQGTNGTQNAIVSTINDADNSPTMYTNFPGGGLGAGQLGDFRGLSGPDRDTYNFYLDQIELDLNKTFGENIRIRADLDFGRFLSGSQRVTADQNFMLEQGYVTANIPFGNGVEFLIGRYNIPLGFESVDRPENIALSFTNMYRFIRPHNVTGAKFYYAFNDIFDWHIGAVNNLYDTIFGVAAQNGTRTINDTPVPSAHTRFGFTWGEKGKEHVVGLSGAAGPEAVVPHVPPAAAIASTNLMKHWTFIGDLDYSFHVTDAFVIAGEGIYRQDNNFGACNVFTPNCKGWAGQITLAYNFNETWNGWLRYEYLHDFQGNYTNIDQQIHTGTLGAGYQITDGAQLKFEGRLDYGLPAGTVQKLQAHQNLSRKYWNSGFAVEFAYNF